jgi:hypothetical protein
MPLDAKMTALIDNDFAYHTASKDDVAAMNANRDQLRDVCQAVMERIPAGREAALVKTKMEEAMYWANAALTRPNPVQR